MLLSKGIGFGLAAALGLLLAGTGIALWCYLGRRSVRGNHRRIALGFAFAFAILEWPFLLIWALYAFGHPSQT